MCVDSGGERVGRAGETDEERVALSIDFVPVVGRECRPQDSLLLGQDGGITLAQALYQSRRSLDVGEEKGHCPAGQFGHGGRSWGELDGPMISIAAHSLSPDRADRSADLVIGEER